MKISTEIPDWANGHLRIFNGVELVAFKLQGHDWKIKNERCSKCGRCCEDCKNLIDRLCQPEFRGRRSGINRPFLCCITGGYPKYSECTEAFD